MPNFYSAKGGFLCFYFIKSLSVQGKKQPVDLWVLHACSRGGSLGWEGRVGLPNSGKSFLYSSSPPLPFAPLNVTYSGLFCCSCSVCSRHPLSLPHFPLGTPTPPSGNPAQPELLLGAAGSHDLTTAGSPAPAESGPRGSRPSQASPQRREAHPRHPCQSRKRRPHLPPCRQ